MRIDRLRKKCEFDDVFANGSRTKGKTFFIYTLHNAGGKAITVGATIAKKFEPSAVRRNYIKRVINGFFQARGAECSKKHKIVVRLVRSTKNIKKRPLSQEIRGELEALLGKAKILK